MEFLEAVVLMLICGNVILLIGFIYMFGKTMILEKMLKETFSLVQKLKTSGLMGGLGQFDTDTKASNKPVKNSLVG